MMLDGDNTTPDETVSENGTAASILIAQLDEGYWLIEGDQHLAALLSAEEPYPTPVYCVRFASKFEMASLPSGGIDTADLWAIHTGIIDRLKRENQLVLVDYSQSA
ncbi:hypothetical protein [Cohaesibacter marisflavi]|nr:hypothetical protein [Cohaesibacter marisflavi]